MPNRVDSSVRVTNEESVVYLHGYANARFQYFQQAFIDNILTTSQTEVHPRVIIRQEEMTPELKEFVKTELFRPHYVLVSREYVDFVEELMNSIPSRHKPKLKRSGELMRTYITTKVENMPLNFAGLGKSLFPDLAKISLSQSAVKKRKTPKNKSRKTTKKRAKK